MYRKSLTVALLVLLVLMVSVLAAPALTGCSGGEDNGSSVEASETPSPAEQPPPAELRRPEAAVYSYLVWISYAYRVLNSKVADHVYTPWEEVRVNSYVQYNIQEGRAIDQRLVDFKVRTNEAKENTATVGITESWVYRYIDVKSERYSSPEYQVSYESTYTLVRQPDGRWLVDKVDAKPLGTVY